MRTQQSGFGGLQLLVVAAAFCAFSLVISPEFQAPDQSQAMMAKQAKIAQAFEYASESQIRISQSFHENRSLPRTKKEAQAMTPDMASKPEFVTDVKVQPDYAGEVVMIMIHLDYGVVENILGGEQYVYLAGFKSDEGQDGIEWQCGARNVDTSLLPAECST